MPLNTTTSSSISATPDLCSIDSGISHTLTICLTETAALETLLKPNFKWLAAPMRMMTRVILLLEELVGPNNCPKGIHVCHNALWQAILSSEWPVVFNFWMFLFLSFWCFLAVPSHCHTVCPLSAIAMSQRIWMTFFVWLWLNLWISRVIIILVVRIMMC